MKYIESGMQGGCFFCSHLESDHDEQNLVLHRGTATFILMNRYPYSNGHLMIAPHRHTGDITDLSAQEINEMMELTQAAVQAIREVMAPEGFNIGYNLGRVAGAGVADHLHLHIVPRWNGDTNFMPIIADTKVINEKLEATYPKLLEAFQALI